MNYLVVGLGNIGAEYAKTRHNIGFMVLDAFAEASNAVFQTARYGDTATVQLRGRQITLLKPSTYMNLSGNAVRYWVNKMNLPLDNLLIICDDLNLPFGSMRMRKKGSDGGHNGLKNIEAMLGTQEYARIRIGIGNDFKAGGQVDFVIGQMRSEELEAVPQICEKAIAGIRDFVMIGADRAMNIFNTAGKNLQDTVSK